jgi:hypothetical protein
VIDRRSLLICLASIPICSAAASDAKMSVEDVFAILGVSQLFVPLSSKYSYQLNAENLPLLVEALKKNNGSYAVYRGFVVEDSVARCLSMMENLS